MSRIHEALKKAEQERAQGERSAAPAPSIHEPMPMESSTGDDLARETVPPVLPAAVQTALAEMTGSVQQLADQLRAKAHKTTWDPDLRKMLFFSGNNHPKVGSEEFRTLRSKLYQIRAKQKLQSVLISSALPEEGKSFVAANLAQVIVRQQGRKALLIDADLRRSALHLFLGAAPAPGMTEYLRGEVSEMDIIQRGPLENLYFIPGGKPASNPAELIATGRLRTLLQAVAAAVDWVIIDSPPVIPVSDATVMADMCDGVLMVVQADVTPLEMAQKARQELHDKPLLGVVLNKVAKDATYSSYYYRYGKEEEASGDGKKSSTEDRR